MAALRDTDSDVRFQALGGFKSSLATQEDRRAAPVLIAVLRDAGARPAEKDEALLFLRRLSGQSLGPDPTGWERWLNERAPN